MVLRKSWNLVIQIPLGAAGENGFFEELKHTEWTVFSGLRSPDDALRGVFYEASAFFILFSETFFEASATLEHFLETAEKHVPPAELKLHETWSHRFFFPNAAEIKKNMKFQRFRIPNPLLDYTRRAWVAPKELFVLARSIIINYVRIYNKIVSNRLHN